MSREKVKIDPDKVAALSAAMMTASMHLRPEPATVAGTDIRASLGRADEGSTIALTYSACAQAASSAIDDLCTSLEHNAEYVQAAAQDGDEALN